MSEYAVIVQNDESQWDDVKGDLYHYPNRYHSILTKGCRVIYYKGKMTNKSFLGSRLSPDPHYFGVGVIGDSIRDPESAKNDRYCEILDYHEFDSAVLAKIDDGYLEEIPESKKSNYWRYGVREISRGIYERILGLTTVSQYSIPLPKDDGDFESYAPVEGEERRRYTSYYERLPYYRNKAIEIHGLSCMVCGIIFERVYGELGRGFIHVHHNKPISASGPTVIDPENDLSVVCPNCHAMIHRKKNDTLSIEELRKICEAARHG